MEVTQIVKYLLKSYITVYNLHTGQPNPNDNGDEAVTPTVEDFKRYFSIARRRGRGFIKTINNEIIDLLKIIHVEQSTLPKNKAGKDPLKDPEDGTLRMILMFLQKEALIYGIEIDDSGSSGISADE